MIAADVIRALAHPTVPVAYLIGRESLPLLVVVALVVGCASVVFDVGSFTHIPSLVRSADLPAANRAMQGSATAAQVAGPGVAGLLVGARSAPQSPFSLTPRVTWRARRVSRGFDAPSHHQ